MLGNPLKYVDPTGMLGVLDSSDPYKESICVTASGAPCGGGVGASGHDNFVLTGMIGLTAGAGGGPSRAPSILGSAIVDALGTAGHQMGQSFAAFADGVIPFGDPLAEFALYDPEEWGVTHFTGEVFPMLAAATATYGLSLEGAIAQSTLQFGTTKNWIRLKGSKSTSGGFRTWGLQWGSNTHYRREIANPTARALNERIRNLKLPGSNWRVRDPGHLHIRRRPD